MRIQFVKWFVVLCTLALPWAVLAQSSVSNSSVFMIISGPNGTIEGEITGQGRDGWHRLVAYSHEVVAPRDSASGQATGRRQHAPFKVVKLINKGSPKLLSAMVGNTPYTVEVSIWSPTAVGNDVKILTYKLSDATVASIRSWMPNKSDPSAQLYPPAEEIAFTYRRIEVTFHNGEITAQDDWSSAADSTKSVAPKQ
jgi:type VI secretion system secreted protein Hcp